MKDLPKRLRIKASMIQLGERIAWGSDAEIMEEAADEIERIEADYDQIKVANYLQEVRLNDAADAIDRLKAENELLRAQLDEARELLCAFAMEHVETIAWLERNK